MNRYQSLILYLFIILIILASLGLFIFKDQVADRFLNYSVASQAVNVNNSGANNDFKLDVLRDSRIKPLKNYVSLFIYNDLNKSQDAILAASKNQTDVVISNPDGGTATKTATTTSSGLTRVKVGHSNPFIVKTR